MSAPILSARSRAAALAQQQNARGAGPGGGGDGGSSSSKLDGISEDDDETPGTLVSASDGGAATQNSCGATTQPKRHPTRIGLVSRKTYQGKALGLLSVDNPLRAFAIACVEDVWFDRLVLSLILVNCLTMVAKDPFATGNQLADVISEWIFLGCFTLEMVSSNKPSIRTMLCFERHGRALGAGHRTA